MNAPLAKEQIALLMSDSLTYRYPAVHGTDGTVADAQPTALARFGAWVTRSMEHLATLPQRRAVLDELRMLSDRELADIGLGRAELSNVFKPGFAASRGR